MVRLAGVQVVDGMNRVPVAEPLVALRRDLGCLFRSACFQRAGSSISRVGQHVIVNAQLENGRGASNERTRASPEMLSVSTLGAAALEVILVPGAPHTHTHTHTLEHGCASMYFQHGGIY